MPARQVVVAQEPVAQEGLQLGARHHSIAACPGKKGLFAVRLCLPESPQPTPPSHTK